MSLNGVSNGAPATGGSARNLNENPLITVSGGDVADFILNGLTTQITSDLGRESIDWHRSYDQPISVYLEANFVKLETDKHFLSEQMVPKHPVTSPNGHHRQASASSASTFSSIPYQRVNSVAHHPTLQNPAISATQSAASVKRNHSFNVIRRNDSNTFSRSGQSQEFPASGYSDSTLMPNGRPQDVDEQVNHPLVKLIGHRFQRTNGAQVLINSYWVDANQDLESYNANVREPLLDWFGQILANSAANCRLGLAAEFSLDCAIVIVCRHDHSKRQPPYGSQNILPPTPTKSNEQVLNLNSLIEQQNRTPQKSAQSSLFKSSFGLSSSKKFTSKTAASSNLNTSLSSSLTSIPSATSVHLNSASSTNQLINPASLPPVQLTVSQLIDQMRNDLSVSFQLFQQKQFTAGNFDSNIPPNPSVIVGQLMERMLIFDYTSNHGTSGAESAISSGSSQTMPLQMAANVSTMKQLSSALSNFGSGGSIKITTPSMIMSPAKAAKGKVPPVPESTSIPVLQYGALVARLRSLLLDAYSKQFEAYERLIRKQRELRNNIDWDFFGFFLLQEELALIYENLGLYSKALIQYDELDALFSQSILNTNAAGGIGPAWLQRRLISEPPEDGAKDSLGASVGGPLGSTEYSSLYSSWNGLCLCNPEAINSLRAKIVQCVLSDEPTADDFTDIDDHDSAFASSAGSSPLRFNSSGPASLGADFQFTDPLGVNLGVTRQGTSPTKSPRIISTSVSSASTSQISLIDFRNYLFAKQCHLLCLLNKPWELASRALPFLQTCVSELNMLEISIAPGGIACWVFLSVLEILHKCERYSDSSQLESYSYHTVGLWSYARDKLAQLGKLCNLMPGSIDCKLNTSDHLHRMVELVAGMGSDPHIRGAGAPTESSQLSPQERLKNALSSSDDFLRNFLEITELTMGTYKHIGYIRSARLIGKELSELYLKLDKPHQALPFLLDHYNLFQTEQWSVLKYEAARLLAQCLEALYFSAYEPKTDADDDSTEPAFNLEATIRSAFRTNLLLLVVRDQSIPETVGVIDREQYIAALRKLLENYAQNGLRLREIAEKLVVDGHSDSLVGKLNYSTPLLTIHNSHSDLFYDSYTSNSTMMLAGNSITSLHRLNSNASSKSKLNTSDGSLPGTSPPPGPGLQMASSVPNTVASPPKPKPRKLDEHIFKISSLEITSSEQNLRTEANIHRSDKSFIAGSRLVMTIQIYSELSMTVPLDHLMVTMEAKPASEGTTRKKSSTSISSGSSGSTEQLDAAEQTTRMQATKGSYLHPYGIMESYHGPAGTGMACRNVEFLLKNPPRNEGGGSSLKFLPQLPVSLLNQRLSDDHNNFRHYRFLGSTYKFDLLAESSQKSLSLVPGLNTFYLGFQSPDQFTNSAQLSRRLFPTSGGVTQNQVNQLWFHFDQLVLLCRQAEEADDLKPELPFAIVEDFSALHSVNTGHLSTNFRLVKCPPTVELMPKIDGDLDGEADQQGSSISLIRASPYTSLLTGVDQLVYIRLNSGTNILPKGLKCFLKITPVVPMPFASASDTYSMASESSLNFDYRLVQVTLHPVDAVISPKDDSVLYFNLDRQIEPFETYELCLKLRSTFLRPQVCAINQWAVSSQSHLTGNLGSVTNLLNPKVASNCRDFQLTVSWSHLDSSNPIQSVSASFQFSLYQPYHLYTKLHTCGRKKLIEVGIRGARELNSHVLHLRQPQLSHYHYSHNQRSTHSAHDSSSPASITFKPLTRSNAGTFPLKPNGELHFIWELESANAELSLASLKQFMLDIAYQDQTIPDKFGNWQTVPYEVRLGTDYSTRYVIREFIEPMTGQKNTELLRVGNSCLFRVTIERIIGSSEEQSEDDEHIMYELVYDTELWSLVTSYRAVDQMAVICPSTGYDSLTSNSTISTVGTSDYSSLASSGPESTKSTAEFNVSSKVLKLTTSEPLFEANFEMMPLADGYIPLPSIRLSRYQPPTVDPDRSSSPTPQASATASVESVRDQTDGNTATKEPKTTIETFSSLSKNWTQKLLSSTPGKNQSSGGGTPVKEHTQIPTLKTGKLIAFETGQVYNFNRASQIYILPSAQPTLFTTDNATLMEAPSSLVSITS